MGRYGLCDKSFSLNWKVFPTYEDFMKMSTELFVILAFHSELVCLGSVRTNMYCIPRQLILE